MALGDELNPADAAVFDTFVVPRYLSLFGELALELLLVGEGARVAHVGCRTGYPSRELMARFPSASLLGVDPSEAALEIARGETGAEAAGPMEFARAATLPLALEAASFSHVLLLHPHGVGAQRRALLAEAHRLLYPGGQLLLAVPLRGSFQETSDLLKEYALKHDEDAFGDRVEQAMLGRPSIEGLAEELEALGFDDVDVEVRATALVFDSGRAFVEDPITRLVLVPALQAELGVEELGRPLAYLRDAIDRYYSEHQFDLTLNVGCASARRW